MNIKLENRHREAFIKIQAWPRDQNNEFDFNLFILMTLILLFSIDYTQPGNRSFMEKNQEKYCLLLQRYLKSIMEKEEANLKFLGAMELIALVESVMEMNQMRAYDISHL